MINKKESICNNCGKGFPISKEDVQSLIDGDYEVQYFRCPHCGKAYQVLTVDAQMRELISQRVKIQRMIQLAMPKKFREKTLRKYERELSNIKKKQLRLNKELRPVGDGILKKHFEEEETT